MKGNQSHLKAMYLEKTTMETTRDLQGPFNQGPPPCEMTALFTVPSLLYFNNYVVLMQRKRAVIDKQTVLKMV